MDKKEIRAIVRGKNKAMTENQIVAAVISIASGSVIDGRSSRLRITPNTLTSPLTSARYIFPILFYPTLYHISFRLSIGICKDIKNLRLGWRWCGLFGMGRRGIRSLFEKSSAKTFIRGSRFGWLIWVCEKGFLMGLCADI